MSFDTLGVSSNSQLLNQQSHQWKAGGCALEPIANYLKALGLLRCIPQSKGWWQSGEFWIESNLSANEVITHLATDRSISPLLSPWNGGSGLWKSDPLLEKVEKCSSNARAARLIAAIQQARSVVAASGLEKQPSKREDKVRLIEACQQQLIDPDWQLWCDTVLVLVEAGKKNKPVKDFVFSRLLGTGGNIGAKDIGYNYLEAWNLLIDFNTGKPLPYAPACWQSAVLGTSLPDSLSNAALLAQYAPKADYTLDEKTYPYQKSGGSSTAMANPADAVLLIEGLLAFSAVARRPLDSADDSVATYSLAVNLAAGTAQTSVSGELRAGVEEFWLPIWNQPRTFKNLRRDLLTELRGPLPRQKVPDSFDFVALLASKADQRKIPQWQRYAFFPRKGQSNFAISLGTFKPERHNLGAELNGFRSALVRFAYSERAPGKVKELARRLESHLFALASGHGKIVPVLALLGEIELYIARSPAVQESVWPLAQLDSEWISKVIEEDSSPTLRLAVSLASLWLRSHISSARPGKKENQFFWSEETTQWGDDIVSNLIRMQRRWQMSSSSSSQSKSDSTPESNREALPSLRIAPTFSDISAFLTGQIDLVQLSRLAAGCALCRTPKDLGFQVNAEDYELLKLPVLYTFSAYCQWSKVGIGSALNQLAQGDSTLAARSVMQRLLANGYSPFSQPTQPELSARQIAAALAFPLSKRQLDNIQHYYFSEKED